MHPVSPTTGSPVTLTSIGIHSGCDKSSDSNPQHLILCPLWPAVCAVCAKSWNKNSPKKVVNVVMWDCWLSFPWWTPSEISRALESSLPVTDFRGAFTKSEYCGDIWRRYAVLAIPHSGFWTLLQWPLYDRYFPGLQGNATPVCGQLVASAVRRISTKGNPKLIWSRLSWYLRRKLF